MSDLIVLGDSAVKEILLNLPKSDIGSIKSAVEDSLIQYSTGSERQYQPGPAAIVRPNGQKTLFRPFTSPEAVGTKIIVHPAPEAGPNVGGVAQQLPLHGILALCDNQGHPIGLINAAEVTGYRTSMSAIIPYMWRRNTANIVVFGAGKQALWHLRLALSLRGSEIKSITVVNRSEARAQTLLKIIREENQSRRRSDCSLNFLNSSISGYDQELEALLSNADIVFCTTASDRPLFPLRYLTHKDRGNNYPFVSAVGSWQPDMIELDPEMLKHVVELGQWSPNGGSSGVVLVDDRPHVLIHAGEIIQSGLGNDQLVDIGQILQWKRNGSSINSDMKESLNSWLGEGFVVYKSVGVGVTDLAAGVAILDIAKKRNMGTSVTGF